MSQKMTQYGTIELCDQDIWNQQQKTNKTKNTSKLGPEEGLMELPIPE